jgi:hypothetical protein
MVALGLLIAGKERQTKFLKFKTLHRSEEPSLKTISPFSRGWPPG